MGVFQIESSVLNDFSLNDIYYKIEGKRLNNFDRLIHEKEVIIINTGSINSINFRKNCISLIDTLFNSSVAVIGVDLTFNNSNSEYKQLIYETVYKNPKLVMAYDSGKNIMFFPGHQGSAVFPIQTNTIRYYNSDSSSLAYQVAKKFKKNIEISNSKYEYFPINYLTFGNGTISLSQYLNNERQSGFLCLNADSLINGYYPQSIIKKILRDKILILGHLGSTCLSNPQNDIEDKFSVPVDTSSLFHRDKIMSGTVIHANAIENFLHPEMKFKELSSFWCIFFQELFSLLFLALLLFGNFGKLFNIFILGLFTIPFLCSIIWLMNIGIYISMGTTLLQLLLIEETLEILEPITLRFENFFASKINI
jgi:hypothetical protein